MFQARCFGGGHDHHHHHEQVRSAKRNTAVNVPSEKDLGKQISDIHIGNDRFLAWVNGRFPVDRLSDKLINDKDNTYSAYHHLRSNPVLQNGLVLKFVRLLFGSSSTPSRVQDNHASFNGVQTHENGVFLYQSKQAPFVLKWGYGDFVTVGLFTTYMLVPSYNFLLLPTLISCAFIPRRWVQQKYFTWHAELLPHTEQVVFHKSHLFGQVDKHIVDIKNLKKVPAELVTNDLMWSSNLFDPDFVFQDEATQELFVFDKQGIWNKDALEHPLLY